MVYQYQITVRYVKHIPQATDHKDQRSNEIIKEQLENNKGGPLVIEIFVPESTPLIPRGGFYKDKNGNNIRRPPWQMYPDLEEIPTLKD